MIKNILNSSQGMGLLEVLIASGLGIAAVVGVTQILDIQTKFSKKNQIFGDFNEQVANIRMVLNNEALCKTALQGKVFNPTASFPQALPGNKIVLSNNNVIAEVGKPATGSKITKLEFKNLLSGPVNITVAPGVTYKKVSTTLTVEAQRVMGTSSNAADLFKKELVVNLMLNASNQIQECFDLASPSQVCYDAGGTYNASANPPCNLDIRVCAAVGGTY